MLNLLKFLDARLGEPSTWASLAALLAALHVNLDPGLWQAITIWGAGASAALGFLLAETSAGKTPRQIAQDTLNLLVAMTNKPPAQGPHA